VFSYVLGGSIVLASAGLLLYFSLRTWLLLRATDARMTATLDRDLRNGWRLWVAIRSLFSPMCMAV
jgi:hypothetical protein